MTYCGGPTSQALQRAHSLHQAMLNTKFVPAVFYRMGFFYEQKTNLIVEIMAQIDWFIAKHDALPHGYERTCFIDAMTDAIERLTKMLNKNPSKNHFIDIDFWDKLKDFHRCLEKDHEDTNDQMYQIIEDVCNKQGTVAQ